jgi:hypothetical protein
MVSLLMSSICPLPYSRVASFEPSHMVFNHSDPFLHTSFITLETYPVLQEIQPISSYSLPAPNTQPACPRQILHCQSHILDLGLNFLDALGSQACNPPIRLRCLRFPALEQVARRIDTPPIASLEVHTLEDASNTLNDRSWTRPMNAGRGVSILDNPSEEWSQFSFHLRAQVGILDQIRAGPRMILIAGSPTWTRVPRGIRPASILSVSCHVSVFHDLRLVGKCLTSFRKGATLTVHRVCDLGDAIATSNFDVSDTGAAEVEIILKVIEKAPYFDAILESG